MVPFFGVASAPEATLDESDEDCSDCGDDEPRTVAPRVHQIPEDYDEQFVYWLYCRNVSSTTGSNNRHHDRYLEIKSHQADTYMDGANKVNLDERFSCPNMLDFEFPKDEVDQANQKGMKAQKFDDMSAKDIGLSKPFLNITLNTLIEPSKVVKIEVLIDLNGDYDNHNRAQYGTSTPPGVEFVIDFPLYPTTGGDKLSPTQQAEETFEAEGTWRNGNEPVAGIDNMDGNGRIYVNICRNDGTHDDGAPETADLIVYTGFTTKATWLAIPYKHKLERPEANAGGDMGFGEDIIWADETEVEFNGTMSYDPDDDLGADHLPDTEDIGEGNHNIENGDPPGEPQWETDNLQYQWNYGQGGGTGFDTDPYAKFTYHIESSYPGLFKIFNATLTVKDDPGNIDTDEFQVKVYKSPGKIPKIDYAYMVPDIDLLQNRYEDVDGDGVMDEDDEPLNDQVCTIFEQTRPSMDAPLEDVEITFYAKADDPESGPNVFIYWDLGGKMLKQASKAEGEVVQWLFSVSAKELGVGRHNIEMTVYDGPKDDPQTRSNVADFKLEILAESQNDGPIGIMEAHHPLGSPFFDGERYQEGFVAVQGVPFVLNATGSYDLDEMPGFDLDEPKDQMYETDLQYRFHFMPQDVIVDQFTPDYNANFSGPFRAGAKPMVNVTLTVFDGLKWSNETYMDIDVDVAPNAYGGPDLPDKGDPDLEVGDVIEFNASRSYDINDEIVFDGLINPDDGESPHIIYNWSFGDRTYYIESESNAPDGDYDGITTHVYQNTPEIEEEGFTIFDVVLTVSDSSGNKDIDKMKVKVYRRNLGPIARGMVTATTAQTYQDIIFDATGSYDPDGKAYRKYDDPEAIGLDADLYYNDLSSLVFWDFGDGKNSTAVNSTHAYEDDGIFTATLWVFDEKGLNDSISFQIIIKNQAPIADAGSNLTYKIKKGQPLMTRFSAVESNDYDGEVRYYLWKFPDSDSWENTSLPYINHTFVDYGTYTVFLRVSDDDGAKSETVEVTYKLEKYEETINEPGWFQSNLIIVTVIIIALAGAILMIFLWGRRLGA